MATTDSTYQPCERSDCQESQSPPSDSQSSTNADRPLQRIALFTGAYNHVLDGVSLTLNRLVKYLTKKGYEVLIVAPTSPEPAVKDYAGTVVPTVSFSLPFRPGIYFLNVSADVPLPPLALSVFSLPAHIDIHTFEREGKGFWCKCGTVF